MAWVYVDILEIISNRNPAAISGSFLMLNKYFCLTLR